MAISKEELVELTQEALDASRFFGRRYNLGKFSVGQVTARWTAEDGNNAELTDRGLRIGNFTPFADRATVLNLSQYHSQSRTLEVVNFEMDLDSGLVDIFRNLVTSESPYKDLFKAGVQKSKERELLLHQPGEDDWVLLREELERGASGEYALR